MKRTLNNVTALQRGEIQGGGAEQVQGDEHETGGADAPRHITPTLLETCGRHGSRWHCEWRGVCGGPSNVKARKHGLFATLRIRKGTRIDYFGVRLGRERWDKLHDQTYCVGIHGTGMYEFVDGHPSWQRKWTPESGLRLFGPRLPPGATLTQMPRDMMLGGLVNEPVPGESVGLKIVGTERTAYFEAIRDVQPGEELLTLYGQEYQRGYPSPYEWIHSKT